MQKRVVRLGENCELIIDEPPEISSNVRSFVIVSILAEILSSSNAPFSTSETGNIILPLGLRIYQIYYEFKVQRIISNLELYNGAISHIAQNPDLYDQRLAKKAIDVLQKTFKENIDK